MDKVINMNELIGAAAGDQQHMLGKFLYFSLANLLVDGKYLVLRNGVLIYAKRNTQQRVFMCGQVLWLRAGNESCELITALVHNIRC